MKKMIVAMAALMLMIGTGAEAQGRKNDMRGEPPTPEQVAQKRTERMTRDLSLNEEQAKQVYNLTLEQARKGAQFRTQADAARAEHMERMKAAREAEATQMKTILTSEQYAKWQENQDKMMRRKGDCKRKGNKRDRGCAMESKRCCDK